MAAIFAALCVFASAAGAHKASAQERSVSQSTFKLWASVTDYSTGGEGGRSQSDAFFNEKGLGDGEGLALAEEGQGGSASKPTFKPTTGSDKDAGSKGAEGLGKAGEKAEEKSAPAKASQKEAATSGKTPEKGSAQAQGGNVPKGQAMDGAGVDWSGWAGTLADKWYQNLVILEEKSKKRFGTRRAAKIKFTCYPDGSIKNISVYRSCGAPEYDRMQIEALKKAQPLPPFPAGTKKTSITMLQGWASHPLKKGEADYKPGSYGKSFPLEKLKKGKPAAGGQKK